MRPNWSDRADPEAGVDFVRRKLKLFMKFMIPTMPAHLSPTSIDIDGPLLPACRFLIFLCVVFSWDVWRTQARRLFLLCPRIPILASEQIHIPHDPVSH